MKLKEAFTVLVETSFDATITQQDAYKGVSVGCTNSQHKLSSYRELQPRVNFRKCGEIKTKRGYFLLLMLLNLPVKTTRPY